MDAKSDLRVALVHDWLNGMRGGEKCLDVFCQLWPDAPIHTLLYKPGTLNETIEQHSIRKSLLQYLPGIHNYYRYTLPVMPLAVPRISEPCDLVLSSSHCVAKSAIVPDGVPHICYCFSPMRYAWHMKDSYFASEKKSLRDRLRDWLLHNMKEWDRRTAQRVTHFVAISETIQQRIRDCYNRDSVVIYPPVDTDFYHPLRQSREDFFLVVSAFAPYKRLDLAIEACTKTNSRLVVIGKGQDEAKLRALAGPTVEFLGWQSNESIRNHLQRCQALLFPGEEDFGIVPVEAQACGTPVIAFGRGGATETVLPAHQSPNPTGLWFPEQSADALIHALEQFEEVKADFDPKTCRDNALKYHTDRFADEFSNYVDLVLNRSAPTERLAA